VLGRALPGQAEFLAEVSLLFAAANPGGSLSGLHRLAKALWLLQLKPEVPRWTGVLEERLQGLEQELKEDEYDEEKDNVEYDEGHQGEISYEYDATKQEDTEVKEDEGEEYQTIRLRSTLRKRLGRKIPYSTKARTRRAMMRTRKTMRKTSSTRNMNQIKLYFATNTSEILFNNELNRPVADCPRVAMTGPSVLLDLAALLVASLAAELRDFNLVAGQAQVGREEQGEVSAEPEKMGSDSSCEKVTFNDVQNDDVARPPRPPVVRLEGLL
jgi:hypothetical protein